MKKEKYLKIIVLLLCTFPLILNNVTGKLTGTSYQWPTAELVSTESTLESAGPTLAMDASGNIHMTWQDKTNYDSDADGFEDIFYKRWNATTGAWTITEVVSTETTYYVLSPTLGTDTSGNVHVAWYDRTNIAGADVNEGGSPTEDIFYKRWNATTGDWTTTEVISTGNDNAVAVSPVLAVDTFGNVHVTWQETDIFYKRWNATTGVWTTSEVVSTESTLFRQSPSLAVDASGNVHMTWNDYSNYGGAGTDTDIFYKRWNTTTDAWTTTEVVSTESNTDSWGPVSSIDTSGNVYVVWYDITDFKGAGSDQDIFYKYWNATTGDWNTTEVVSTTSTGISSSPALAVDAKGNVHVTWKDQTDYIGAGTDYDIFYRIRNPVLDEWTTVDVVSTESTEDSDGPSMVTDSSGNVHVTWADPTDYNGAGSDQDIFYKFWDRGRGDSDNDGLLDWEELKVYGTNLYKLDTDNDNFHDGYEVVYGSNPLDATDFPVISQDWYDVININLEGNATLINIVTALASGNSNDLANINGSLSSSIEIIKDIIDQLGISVGDTDYDGLSDLDELSYGTSIVLIDTDCDNLNDGFEINIGTDPLDNDSDGDSFIDGIELLSGTNPKDALDFPGSSPSSTSTVPPTTIPTTSPSSSTDTSTSSKSGSFPDVFLILSLLCVCVIYLRKTKRR